MSRPNDHIIKPELPLAVNGFFYLFCMRPAGSPTPSTRFIFASQVVYLQLFIREMNQPDAVANQLPSRNSSRQYFQPATPQSIESQDSNPMKPHLRLPFQAVCLHAAEFRTGFPPLSTKSSTACPEVLVLGISLDIGHWALKILIPPAPLPLTKAAKAWIFSLASGGRTGNVSPS